MNCVKGDLAYVAEDVHVNGGSCKCFLGYTLVVQNLSQVRGAPMWEVAPPWRACPHLKLYLGWDQVTHIGDAMLKPIRGVPQGIKRDEPVAELT